MDPRLPAADRLTDDATEFVRFCYRRRSVGWPELYDEMCAVSNRGAFRGWGPEELAANGIGFGLFELPALAALARRVVEEEQAARRTPMLRSGRRGRETASDDAIAEGETERLGIAIAG